MTKEHFRPEEGHSLIYPPANDRISLGGQLVTPISRRSFLKLSLFSVLGWSFRPHPPKRGRTYPLPGPIGRIATDEKTVSIYEKPDYESEVIRDTHFDELINLYYERKIEAEDEEELNPYTWYRVWGGFLPGVYVQNTYFRLNPPLKAIPDCGILGEVTVPYTGAYQEDSNSGWKKKYRLYYGTTHWITDAEPGPDGELWYKLTSELSDTLYYFVRRAHLRPVPSTEYIPISIDVPPHEKRIQVSLRKQQLVAYEYEQPVKVMTISSGLGFDEIPRGTATPTGSYNVVSKYPTKHMGSIVATGAPGNYSLPGVPWTTFFIYETGVAFHGTYWHNNFGHKMSHGCINMKNRDAKWLYRWSHPPYDPPYRGHCDWEILGRGTRIHISH